MESVIEVYLYIRKTKRRCILDMIIGHIQNLEHEMYKFPESIQKALAFINKSDFSKLKPGRYEIDGDRIFAMVQHYKTKPAEQCRAETHQKYIDLQYVAEGEEYMGYCALSPILEVEEDCLKEKDAKFYKKIFPESNILLSKGSYALLYPLDVHCPTCMVNKPTDVIKVVVKISVDTVK